MRPCLHARARARMRIQVSLRVARRWWENNPRECVHADQSGGTHDFMPTRARERTSLKVVVRVRLRGSVAMVWRE